MGMEDYNIEIRSMSNFAKRIFGRMNAFVMPSFFARSELNYLFVSEEWFNSLPEPEKRALIGHEMIHIRNNHVPKRVFFTLSAALVSVQLKIAARKAGIRHEFQFGYNDFDGVYKFYRFSIIDKIFCAALIAWFIRQQEKEADIEGAKSMNAADGAVQFWERVINETEDPESVFR